MIKDRNSERRPSAQRIAVLVAVVCGAAAIYGTMQVIGNGTSKSASAPAQEAPATSLGAFVRKVTPEALSTASFQAADGSTVNLSAWHGRVVLLNLWATWCLPCRKEMPALDRLQKALGSSDFEVVALSIDRSGAAGARKFLDGVGVNTLKLYVDPTARLANEFKAIGLPTTLLIDRQGREIGRLIGPAEWDSPDAQTLIRSALASK